MIFCNEQLLQRLTKEFLKEAISATSYERMLQRVTSYFTTSNKQRVNFNEYRAASEKLRLVQKRKKISPAQLAISGSSISKPNCICIS